MRQGRRATRASLPGCAAAVVAGAFLGLWIPWSMPVAACVAVAVVGAALWTCVGRCRSWALASAWTSAAAMALIGFALVPESSASPLVSSNVHQWALWAATFTGRGGATEATLVVRLEK